MLLLKFPVYRLTSNVMFSIRFSAFPPFEQIIAEQYAKRDKPYPVIVFDYGLN